MLLFLWLAGWSIKTGLRVEKSEEQQSEEEEKRSLTRDWTVSGRRRDVEERVSDG
jgi:hypothetical protein